MATRKTTVAHFEDVLDHDPRLAVKAMFGEYAIYFDGRVVGLICDDRIFIKVTPGTRDLVPPDTELAAPYPSAKPAFVASEAILDEPELLTQLLSAARRDMGPKQDKPKSSVTPKTRRLRGST